MAFPLPLLLCGLCDPDQNATNSSELSLVLTTECSLSLAAEVKLLGEGVGFPNH